MTKRNNTSAGTDRNTSEQVVGTPSVFTARVAEWRPITIDLAATTSNAVAPVWITEGMNSLDARFDWTQLVDPGCVGWLNPPFARIAPFAAKCSDFAARCAPGATVAMLVPAAVSTNWYAEHVHGKCLALWVRPRIKFVGHAQTFPKDLALFMFGRNMSGKRLEGFATWQWRYPRQWIGQPLASVMPDSESSKC
jgi:hypothetical protein